MAKNDRVKKDTIASYKKRLFELEEILPKITNIKLSKKMEEEWSEIDKKVEKIVTEIENEKSREMRKVDIFQKALLLLKKPKELRLI